MSGKREPQPRGWRTELALWAIFVVSVAYLVGLPLVMAYYTMHPVEP